MNIKSVVRRIVVFVLCASTFFSSSSIVTFAKEVSPLSAANLRLVDSGEVARTRAENNVRDEIKKKEVILYD